MKDIEIKFQRREFGLCQYNQEDSPCNGMNNVSIMAHKKKVKNRKKHDLVKYGQHPTIAFRISRSGRNKTLNLLTTHISMAEINKRTKLSCRSTRSSEAIKRNSIFNSKFIINRVSGYHFNEYLSPFNFPMQRKWKVYRCQLSKTEDSCCCSCNSDAMFEVMKGLYDCYKKKNCDKCKCILCSHLLREERRLGKEKLSLSELGAKEKKSAIRKAEKMLVGKSPEQKEEILKELIKLGKPLPKGRTASEKELIKKVKAELREQVTEVSTQSVKLKRAKAAGLITPLEGKSPEQKEKIIKGLAMHGLPLPEAKTTSEKKLMDKVRIEIGLPPEAKTASMKKKYARAASAGLLQPLEGKSPKEKERILQGLHDLGIPLPEGRTASERALIGKVKARTRAPSVSPSERVRKAKAAGLLTPIEGKPSEQQEKILRGLAMQGLPLPEGRTASEKKLIDKVRADLGLPPEPKTVSMKEKHARAADAGLLQPLEGKSPQEKERIVQGLYDRGIPLPEGRTASERALIAKVKAGERMAIVRPSAKLRKAEAAGLLTPLEGKSRTEKEKILRGLAMEGVLIPEPKTASDKKITEKVRVELGLPPEPKTTSMKDKYAKAAYEGILEPLEGKSRQEKEKILRGLHGRGIPLPKARTASEKSLIAKVKAGVRAPSVTPFERRRKAKAAGVLTPLEGKTRSEKERILKGLARQGLPLPEGKTSSERKLIEKVRADLGLPPEPKTASMRGKYAEAADEGLMQPLEGKSRHEKEKILRGLHCRGIPLPEGRSASERALIAKVQAGESIATVTPSAKLRKAEAAGLLTPLEGKTRLEKEKILRGLAMEGILLPEAETATEKMIMDKVRADLGLPPEPKTTSMKHKYAKAADARLLQPLEGKSPQEKERILRGLHDRGIPLPIGRTASEKALIAKVKARERAPSVTPSEKLRKAEAAGLLTPLEGKTPAQQEKILKGLAMQGLLLPDAKTAMEKKIIDKVRADLGLPPEPKTVSMKEKYAKAADAGLMKPLEGKSPQEKERILRCLHDRGIPLPVGRTASEKSLIAKVKAGIPAPSVTPSERMLGAKVAGVLTPIDGKPLEQQEKILKGLAMQGLPLPEGKTASENKLIEKVRADLGLPPEPKTISMTEKHAKAADAGFLQPLEGKTPQEKGRILKGLHDRGIPLPEGRTASERVLIAKVKAGELIPTVTPSAKLRKAEAAGLLKPLDGKTHSQKEKIIKGLAMEGILLPEAKTASEKKIIEKVRADLGLPPEQKTTSMKDKYAKAADDGLLQPLEGKSPQEKERILRGLHDRGIPLPEGRTASEKSLIAKVKAGVRAPSVTPSERMRRAKAAGVLTPLVGKSPAQKEKILKGLARQGLPLPEGKTASERKIIERIRADLGLPPEPKTASMKDKYAKAAAAGLMQPLEGKSRQEKGRILRGLHDRGIPLPEGRSASERALIAKVKAGERAPTVTPSAKLRKAEAVGLLTPLEGKTRSEKEKILRGLAMEGILLPEAETATEKMIMDKVRGDLGLPPEPKTASMKHKYAKTADAGLLQPLEGKSPQEKERILQGLHDRGIPLPTGRTTSEKAVIAKVKSRERAPSMTPSERLRKAEAAGLLTPLEGKSFTQQEKILKGLAMHGLPLPEGKTASKRKIIEKVRADLGLPPEPKTESMKEKYAKATDAGILQPLEGKSLQEKERILRGLHDRGIPLPTGRTSSEKSLIAKVKAGIRAPSVTPSERLRKAKAAGLLTPLEGKSTAQQEKVLRGLAMQGLPLPEGKTVSAKKLLAKVRADLGLPPEPRTAVMKDKYAKAADAGLLQPLEGKSPKEKEKILRGLHDRGIPLPEGRTLSEKALIAKVKAKEKPPFITPSERLRKAKAAGLLSPLEGKTVSHKEKIIKGLAMEGLPLPEAKTASEKILMEKIRADLGLPPEPKTSSMKEKYARALDAGLMQPLEGKTRQEKARILQTLHDKGIPLPAGRTVSEKALIAKVKAGIRLPSVSSYERLRKAEAAGLLTPLEGKTDSQKEKIIRGLAMEGLLLPIAETVSERKIIEKVRADLGLPPEPDTAPMRAKHARAAHVGILQPLEGKSPREKEKILQGLQDRGIPLPQGRTPSERAIIAKVKAGERAPIITPSERLRKAKAAGLLTPIEGKSPERQEKILKGLAMQGLPLPEGKTASDIKLIEKVRADLGLPPEPKTTSMREKYAKAADAGFLQPLEGKSRQEKGRILQGLHDRGIPLPEGRTASERALIAKVKAGVFVPTVTPSTKLRKAEAAGLLTPLEGKTLSQKENIIRGLAMEGILLPEAETASEKKIMEIVRADLGLPPEPKTTSMKEKYAKAADAGLLQPLEGKSLRKKERILQGLQNRGIPLPEGRTASERALIAKVKAGERVPFISPSEKLRKAKIAGLLTPLEGKPPSQQEKILKGLAMEGLPLPEGKTASKKKLIEKVRADLGLPPEPLTASMREKYARAAEAGFILPLEGKSPEEKGRILQRLHDRGIPLPEGRTASERALIAKVKAGELIPIVSPSAKLRKAEAAGLLTPLEGKTRSQKEKIIKGLVMEGILLPEADTASEKKIMGRVRADLGLPPEPKTANLKEKYAKAADEGFMQPLEGKSKQEKERILRGLYDRGIPLPEARTASEKSLIAKVKAGVRVPSVTPSERLWRAKAAGVLTPLEGKTPSQKEKILRGLAREGLPLPEGKTTSEVKLIEKVRADLGLPPEPKTASMKDKYAKAAAAGLMQPLEGKTPQEKEIILQGLHDRGIPLPEGRSASERALIARVKAGVSIVTPSAKLRKAKAAGLITPLEGKTRYQKEKILKGLAMEGILLPEPETKSEKIIMEKVRADLGLPPEPKTTSMKHKYAKAADAGLLQPLEGKSPQEKERILQGLHDKGIPLPEGRTASEKALIAKVKARERAPSKTPSERLRKAEAAGLLTPLEGKPSEQQEKILKGLALQGLPLPVAKTASEKKIIDKVRADLGLPPEPKTASMKEKYAKAADTGLLQPLEGKSRQEKERILRGLHDRGIPLPTGRTASEKSLIAKVKAGIRAASVTPSERRLKAKAAGVLTPIEGKPVDQQEKILRGLAMQGLPLPVGRTASQRKLIDKVRTDLGLPPEPKTASMKDKYAKAADAGLLQPLEEKSTQEKERILRGLYDRGIPLPEGRTTSERALISKVKAGKATALSITTEKLKRAKAAGLLTPLEGKTSDEKEKILRGLAESGLPLPHGKTSSEKTMIKKIKRELGVVERTPSQKMRKAKKTGLLTPLEGKTHSQKEKILRGRVAAGLPLPVGRTSSERSLIEKIKADTGYISPTLSDRMKRARDAGLLTPLEGKTASAKEKILRDRVAAGIPLPSGKTLSEQNIIKKITLGELPAAKRPSEKFREADTASEKEKILKNLRRARKPLPEGRTASEKKLIAKVKAESRIPSKITSEKLRKAREAGLLTPLTGKSSREKERILKGLVELGLPLPESQTASEKKIAEKVRKDLGLPPEAKTLSQKVKMHRAEAAGIVTPLEGKSPSEKERIIKGMVAAGIPLPVGRTTSEKSMIKKAKAEEGKLSPTAVIGLLTPLEGKTPSQKEKNIKARAEAGIPLPEGKTTSEKALIQKVRADLGMPPPAKTISEKEVVRRAKAEGLLTPIAGKSPKEKERILEGLAEAGLPLPEGKTSSEKILIRKIRAETGLPPEPTPSEKRGEIKTKTKKIGISPPKRRTKSMVAGITEQFEDIIKTTTCDRGCGCDKKKIRFKHSYVKIRVTSPDISSLCDCPDECIPGVKAGAFIDNEGIKVTIGRVNGVTSFHSQYSSHSLETSKNIITLYNKILTDSYSSNTTIDTVDASFHNTFEASNLKQSLFDACPILRCPIIIDKMNADLDTSCTYTSSSYDSNIDKINNIESDKTTSLLESSANENYSDEPDRFVDSSTYIEPSGDSCKSSSHTLLKCSASYDSILIFKSESSLSLKTVSSASIGVTSLISLSNSSYYAPSSAQYLYYPVSNGHFSDSTVEETELYPNKLDYNENDDSGDDTITSDSDKQERLALFNRAHAGNIENGADYIDIKESDYFTYKFSETKMASVHNVQRSTRKTRNKESVVVISNLDSDHDITTMVNQLLTRNDISDGSSIFVIVPTSDDNDSDLSSDCSTICIQLSKHYPNWTKKQCYIEEPDISSRRASSGTHGLKISAKGKMYFMEGFQETLVSSHTKETTLLSFHNKETMYKNEPPKLCSHKFEEKAKTKNKLCQISTPSQNRILCRGVSTDTTSDRPCCCTPKIQEKHHCKPRHQYVPNMVPEMVTPLLVSQGLNSDSGYHWAKEKSSVKFINKGATPVSPCAISPCRAHPGDHHTHKYVPFISPKSPRVSEMPKPYYEPNQPQIDRHISERCQSQMSRADSERCPSHMSRDVSERCPYYMSRAVPERCPSQTSRAISKRCPSQTSRAVSERCPSHMSRDVSRRCPSHMSRDVSERCPSHISRDVSERCPSQISGEVSELSQSQISTDISERCQSQVSMDVSEPCRSQVSTDVSEQCQSQVSTDVSEQCQSQVSTDVSEQCQSQMPRPFSKWNKPQVPRPVPEWNQPQMPRPVPEWNQRRMPRPVLEWNQPQMPRPVPEWNQPHMPRPVPEWNQPQMPRPVSEWNQSQMPRPVSERNQSQMPRLVSERNQSQMPRPVSERNQSHIPEPITALKHNEPCQCSPERIREIFEQVLKGKPPSPNYKSTGCGGAVADKQPTNRPAPEKICCDKEPLDKAPIDKVICCRPQDSDDKQDSVKCQHHKHKRDHKRECSCSGKNRTIKIGPLCPCEQLQPLVSKVISGPKEGTRSLASQCCCCDDSTIKVTTKLEVLGPVGGVCQMEPGGTACQAGRLLEPTATETKPTESKTPREGCDCIQGKNEKKKKNVVCECPHSESNHKTKSKSRNHTEPERKAEAEPESEPKPEPEPELDPYYYRYQGYQWVDEKQVLRQKSDMTQTQSGFRFLKKKKQPEPELSVEDAVRYYVSMNPDLIKEYCPPPPEPKDCPCKDTVIKKQSLIERLTRKKRRNAIDWNDKIQCECPFEESKTSVPSAGVTQQRVPSTRVPSTRVPATRVSATRAATKRATPEPVSPMSVPTPPLEEPEDEAPSGGIKFSIGGKGSASKGLSGVCCFDMIQETDMSTPTHFK